MTHVVVGIIKKDNPLSYLLISSKTNFGKYSGFYYPPAGHVEKHEDELTALKREIYEELGMKVVIAKKITDTKSDVKNQKLSWYFCEVDSYEFKLDTKELNNGGFFTQSQMVSINIWPATLEIFEKFVFNS